MNRRGFLHALSRAPAVGVAARAAIEQEAAGLVRVGMLGGAVPASSGPPDYPQAAEEPTPDQIRHALLSPFVRRQVESILYEEQRHVGTIDPDIAVLRSFSLSAKIAFQRQRNVGHRLAMISEGPTRWSWRRVNAVILRAVGLRAA